MPAVVSASIYSAEERTTAAARSEQQRVLAELVRSGLAERVSVKRSALDANLMVVRPAAGNGAKTVPGARPAVLIYLDTDES